MTAAELALALVRTTLATSAAACLAVILLAVLRIDSPRTHRVVWLIVVLQGWLLFSFTFELTGPPQPAPSPPLDAMSSSAWTPTEPTFMTELPPVAELAPAEPLITPTQLALAAWLVGATLLTLYAATRYVRIVRALPLGAPPDDSLWKDEWNASLGAVIPRTAEKRINFRITARLGPLVAYIPFAYILLAPRPLWTTLTPAERTAILRHELAHIRRRDLWKSLAIRLLALPQWFNPFVWRAVRRFDEAAEWACDAVACSAATNKRAACDLAPQPTTLANALLRTAELASAHKTPRPAGLVPAVPSGSSNKTRTALQRRIHRLITPRFKEESAMRRLAIPALLAALAAAQLIRIERVSAFDPPPSQGGSPSSSAAASEPTLAGTLSEADSTTSASAADPAATSNSAPLKRRPYEEQAWPRYIIEPPDMLQLSGVKLIPKGPHKIDAFDVLRIRVAGAFPDQPIDDSYSVDADGTINLGPTYGRVRIIGMTIEEVEAELRNKLAKILTEAEVSASLIATAGAQQIDGQHLVAMDGRVNLGVYGSVYVAGMTIEEARAAIEKMLSKHLENPQVAVDVLAYNSKVYYVVLKGSRGDNVNRMPVTGNETVLDAVANINIRTTDGVKMWIVRQPADGIGDQHVIPVAWNEIADGSSDDTNYTLQPGDRLFIDEPRYRDDKPQDERNEPADEDAAALPNYYMYVRPQVGSAPPVIESRRVSQIDLNGDPVPTTSNDEPAPEAGPPIYESDSPEHYNPYAPAPRDPDHAGPDTASGEAPEQVLTRLSERWLETARPNDPPVQPPQPVQERPIAAEAQQVLFKLSIIRDTSGDMAELGDSLREDGSATGDTESMLGVLRIMRKHKLVEVVADPMLVTVLGRPASLAIEPQATGDAGKLTADVGPISVKDGVLRLEAGMSLGEARIDRGFDLPLGETLVLAAPPHDKAGAGRLYLVVTPELVDGANPPQP